MNNRRIMLTTVSYESRTNKIFDAKWLKAVFLYFCKRWPKEFTGEMDIHPLNVVLKE